MPFGTRTFAKILLLAMLTVVLVTTPIAEPILTPIAHVQGQTSSVAHLTMNVTGQTLTAGFNTTVTISLSNNYYNTVYGTGTIYDMDLSISLPTPLNLLGDNHWHFDSIAYGQKITISFRVYAPTSAIGSSYQGTVTATYKQLGDISSTTESHAVGFSVYGWINMIIYSIQMTPSSVAPGGNATVSGNVLNTGNLAAFNANVTVTSDTLASTSSSGAFIGEIDPNIPRPFSLLVAFKNTVPNGTYTLTVKVSAVDTSRPGIPITNQKTFQVQIRKPAQQPVTQRTQPTGPIDMLFQVLRNLYNVFMGSLTGILTPIEWQLASHSHYRAITESNFRFHLN
jgi:uncharacterized membrane protein